MSKLSKYGRTFGFIFGAALFVSGVNTVVATNTGAPSIAKYSLTYDFAERLVAAFATDHGEVPAMSAINDHVDPNVVLATADAAARSGS